MIATLIIVAGIIVALGYAIATRGILIREENFSKWITMPVVILVVGIMVGLIQPYALERQHVGHVVIKVNLTGNERGVSDYQYKTGWITYNTWTENLYEFPTFQQHIEYDSVNVIMKGGFSATIRPSFNYNLISTAVGDMFVNLRVDIKMIEQGWLKTAIIGSVNDVANKWSVDDVFNKREQFESEIVAECNKRVSKWFMVSQLRTNITPPQALQKAIIDKTNQITLAQAELSKAITADAAAKVKIANARGDSAQAVIAASGRANATIIEAEAEAKAMKLKQQQLSPMYNDYIRANNWDGHYPATMLGGNSNTLLNLK